MATKSKLALNEEEVLQQWEEKKIFEKTLLKPSPKGNYVFFEGPPTANGKPGLHHVLARSFKDVMPRYKTMRGFHVERKAGWDTHGLPVELQVEKLLGISGKPDIEKYGVEAFNKKCKETVWSFTDEWKTMTRRIGYWLDMEHPYITYTNEYMESVWNVLSKVHERKLLYKGYKVVPHCPSCGTALSSHEVAQGYQTVTDASIYIKFKLKNKENTYLLSWTTTPWTLPGNVALAVGADIEYVKVKWQDQYVILARNLVMAVFGEPLPVEEQYLGKDLAGWEYESLFPGAVDPGDKKAWFVGAGDFVSTTDGTGIVHTACMYGVDDFNFGKQHDLPFVHTVDEAGKFKESVTKWAGKFVKNKEVEKQIIADLNERGLLIKEMPFEHEYPFCWRCSTPLLYYAKDSWFIAMESLRADLLKENASINWEPSHIKDGRFGEWLAGAKDWAISRQRYWGTPMPIWECADCGAFDVMGSMADVEKHAGALPKDSDGNVDLHRPFVDELSYACSCGKTKKRVLDVLDVWLDSGTMPLSQHHYPFENKELIDKGEQYPADFISEAIDQTRGWFYTLLAVSVALGMKAPYKNVICLGHIRDKFGKKMSKSKGNIVDAMALCDLYGADSLRMYLFTHNQPGEPRNFDEKDIGEMVRKAPMLIGNIVNFYEMYATADVPLVLDATQLPQTNALDQWIMAELTVLVQQTTDDLESYHVYEAGRRLLDFVNELSTWYVRRSRDRFKDDGADKTAALQTMGFVLMTVTKLCAPFMPFLAERLYARLGGKLDSVHLEDWPMIDESFANRDLQDAMLHARQVVELALAVRDEAKMKVRQPLATLLYEGVVLTPELIAIVAEEVNVLAVEKGEVFMQTGWAVKEAGSVKVALALELSEDLKRAGTLRELVRQVNNFRKQSLLTIQDQVVLYWESLSETIQTVMNDAALSDELKKSTLVREIVAGKPDADVVTKELSVNDEVITVGLKK